MTNPRTIQPDARKVIVGVDTHTHVHVAVAIDTWGIRLGDRSCAADSDGYQQLITWAERHGRVAAFGIEGTGSDGAGLARAVRRAGHQVLEVNRGDRRTRRIAGKSDPVDAETAARSVLAGQSTAIPKRRPPRTGRRRGQRRRAGPTALYGDADHQRGRGAAHAGAGQAALYDHHRETRTSPARERSPARGRPRGGLVTGLLSGDGRVIAGRSRKVSET